MEEQYTGIEVTDMIEDTGEVDDDQENSEYIDTELNISDLQDTDNIHSNPEALDIDEGNIEAQVLEKKKVVQKSDPKLLQLPTSRIKHIMKMDPDVTVVNSDAVFLVTKATELFLQTLAKEAHTYIAKNKKIIQKKDLDHVINVVDCLCFLEGAMDF